MELCQASGKALEADVSRLMEQYGDGLLRFCCLHLGDLQLAEDAVQETFLKAYRKFPQFRGDSSEMSWLCAIALNCCRDLRRKNWFRRETARPAEEMPSNGAEPGLPDDSLVREVMRLGTKYREVVLLHYYQGLSLREMSAILKTSESTLSTRLVRAREQLKSRLKGWYWDEE